MTSVFACLVKVQFKKPLFLTFNTIYVNQVCSTQHVYL